MTFPKDKENIKLNSLNYYAENKANDISSIGKNSFAFIEAD